MGLLGSLGSLNVLLSADTAQFSSALDKAAYLAERDLQRISRTAKINGAIVATALVAAASAFAVKMKNVIDSAEKMNKVAQSFGMTTEELSKLQYAAQLSDLSIDDMTKSFARLNKSAFDNVNAFKMLGISQEFLNKHSKDTYGILLEVADRFSRMPDGIGKSTAAQQIFGRSGAALIPLLNQGAAGLKAYGDEAERMGLVLDSKTAKSAEKFADDMKRMTKQIDGAFLSIGSTLIPVLSGLTENLKSAGKETDNFASAGRGLAVVLVSIVNSGMMISEVFKTVGTHLGDMGAVAMSVAKGQFQTAVELMKKSSEDHNSSWAKTVEDIQKNWDLLAENAGKNAETTTSTMSGPMIEFTKEMEESIKHIESMGKGIGSAFGKAFDDAILEGTKFRDVMLGLLKDIEAAILKSMITQPLADAIGAGVSSFFKPAGAGMTKTVSVTSLPSRHGNIFSNGSVVPFASGGIVGSPTLFPMANGGTGLAGEAGKEAILPLTRLSGGDLGVKASGGGTIVNVYAPAGSSVKKEQKTEGDREIINIMIDEAVAGNVNDPGSKTYKSMRNTFGVSQALTRR
jgi:DNA-binding phage protein